MLQPVRSMGLAIQPGSSDGWLDALGKVVAGEALLCHGVASQLATDLRTELVVLLAASGAAILTLWHTRRSGDVRAPPRTLQYVMRVVIVLLLGASTRPVVVTWTHVSPLYLASAAVIIAVMSPFILLAPIATRSRRG